MAEELVAASGAASEVQLASVSDSETLAAVSAEAPATASGPESVGRSGEASAEAPGTASGAGTGSGSDGLMAEASSVEASASASGAPWASHSQRD